MVYLVMRKVRAAASAVTRGSRAMVATENLPVTEAGAGLVVNGSEVNR